MSQPDSDELNPTRSFYDRMSRAYDLIADAGEHDARQKGIDLLALRTGESVLEIGFGTGQALAEMAGAVGTTGRVVGIDISPGMCEVARQRLVRMGLADRVELHVDAAPPLPVDDASIDAAFMSFTLELFPAETIPLVLAEVRRVLRPDGRLAVVCMAEPSEGQRESVLERAYRWMHRHFPHIVDCRPIDVGTLLAEAGFRLVERVDLEIWSLPVTAAVARRQRTAGPKPAG